MKDPLILFADIIAQIELEGRWQTHPETMQTVQNYSDRYKGSAIDITLLADRVIAIADEIKNKYKERAYEEALLQGHEGKFTRLGNGIIPVESHLKYVYPDDDYISKVSEDLKPITSQLKSLKKKEKGLKDSIKARQKELVEQGSATKTGSTKFIKISKR